MELGKAGAANQAVNTPLSDVGPGGSGGLLNNQKDAKEASTEAKFGDVWQQIQTKYGAKAEKPREIKKTLGKDDFLRIMVTQMKHQDPTNPFKAEQMAAQMAQFASVEQLQNINQSMGKLMNANQPIERMAMTNMIGKVVTVDRERFPHTEGQGDALSFVLPADASEVKATILSDAGETLFQKDLGPLKAGENTFTWDGNKANTLPAKAGTYMFRVEAKDQKGGTIQINPQTQARVVGISFEGAEPVFLIGNSVSQEKVTMKNIVRIETDGGQVAAAPGVAAAQKKPNFIAFQKGVGSGNLGVSGMAPEVSEALAKYQQQTDGKATEKTAATGEKSPSGEDKGFPNGLHDSDEQVAAQSNVNHNENSKGGE